MTNPTPPTTEAPVVDTENTHETLGQKKPQKVGDILHRIPRPLHHDKNWFNKINYAPKRNSLALLSVMLWAWTALCLSSMLILPLPEWKALLLQQHWVPIEYALQVPLVVLVGGILGSRYGTLVVLAYLATGFMLGFPIFSNGGGLPYSYEPTVGYLLGMGFTPLLMHQELKKGFTMKGWFRGRSFFLIFAALMAVLGIHTTGVVGLLFQVGLGHLTWPEALSWLSHCTFVLLPYDAFLACVAVCLVRLTRLSLYCCLY
jgi:biotin transport system substrate-specific component